MESKTVLQVLEKKYPEAVSNWDHWNYRINAPMSLDDSPHIQVILINKNSSGYVGCRLDLEELNLKR